MANFDAILKRLRQHGQEHLLAFYGELDGPAQQSLLEQIDGIDLDQMDRLIRTQVLQSPKFELPPDLQPAPILPAPAHVTAGKAPAGNASLAAMYSSARKSGEKLIAAGKVAALVVAGGAGSRLGFDGPKGCLAVTPVRRKPLFQVFAEQLLATARRYGHAVPWYIMTSQANDAAIRKFFADNRSFGLNAEDVFFFTQGQMPAVGLDGKILLEAKDRIAWNPDGHGGTLTALRRSGALADMARRGVEQISYFQVDNPLVHCVDPLFVGLHAQAGAGMSAKALPKREPLEKLGNFCQSQGKVIVIEYSDLPEKLAYATRPDGTLLFSSGSIAIHVIARAFADELTAGGAAELPFHRAVKKAAYIDSAGNLVKPTEPNAVKFERFIFDALPLSADTVILQTVRSEEFSPIKNTSRTDSLEAALHDQVRRAAEWLESVSLNVPRDAEGEVAAAIEISPLLALDAKELAGRIDKSLAIRPGQEVYLE